MAARTFPLIDLRNAIERRQIVPSFQPIVALRTGQLWGFEVLARWHHPQLGLISPERFIPLAETTGLIGPLFQAMLAGAIDTFGLMAASTSGVPEYLTLSVNISPVQLRDRLLPEQIRSTTEQAGFPASRLMIEITESGLVGNLELARGIADDLKAMGVRLALDDFGTGYSSLLHLNSLPLDEIKIDRSFVQSMSYRRESRKIAAAIIGLGHSLGLTTIAEGIEDKTHADMLFYLGCELGQGWLYSPPVPAADIPAILGRDALASAAGTPMLAADMASGLEASPAQRLAQLQAIYDGAPVGLCFIDRDLRYVSQNQHLSEISAAPLGPRLGKKIAEAMPMVYLQMEPYLRRALEGEAIPHLEILTERPGSPSELNTILVSLQPARDEAGEIVGISIAGMDITERKRIEQALRESEEHYRNTVELSPHVTWTAAPDGKILGASPRWEQLTGLKLSETLGYGWRNALHPDDLAATDKKWAASLADGNPVDVEFRISHGDGTWRWMRSRARARRGENGEIVRWYGVVEDIDDRKRAEEARRAAEDRLEALQKMCGREIT
ncbi:MAG TPA: EAL domain-containing protein [Silvibacterium sp.]|nr:EAL domain-containing protein [Silvibacterium sp.]